MARRVLPALSGPMQLAQTTAQGFDFLLVSILLPLGQFQGLEHSLHVVQRASEFIDDLVNLFDGLLNGHWGPRLRLTGWRPGNLPWLAHGRRGSLRRFAHRRRRSLLFARAGFRDALYCLAFSFRPWERFLADGAGSSPPAPSASTPATPAAPGGLRRIRLRRHFACWFRFLVGSHSDSKVP